MQLLQRDESSLKERGGYSGYSRQGKKGDGSEELGG
jgi:hypothetical protein